MRPHLLFPDYCHTIKQSKVFPIICLCKISTLGIVKNIRNYLAPGSSCDILNINCGGKVNKSRFQIQYSSEQRILYKLIVLLASIERTQFFNFVTANDVRRKRIIK